MNILNKNLFRDVLLGTSLLVLSSCSASDSTVGSSVTAESKIKIGGSSETYEVLELLAEAHGTEGVEVEFLPPSQTDGGILGVQTKAIDIGGVSREVAAAETGDELEAMTLVRAPLVLVAHDSVTGVANITTEQVIGIYSGEINNWQQLGGPNADIVLLDLAEDENEKKVLRQVLLGEDLVVTDQAIVFAEDDELLETASTTEFSFTAIPLEDELDEVPLTVLDLNGIEPSAANIQSGDYEMALSLGIIVPKEPSAEVASFIEFMTSAEAKEVLSEAEYVVVETN